MKPVVTLFLACFLILAGCQSLPGESTEAIGRGAVLLSSQHCLSEHLKEQNRVHYGPCLKIISVDGDTPTIRDDGFIELPAAESATLGVSCVYRHADGSPIPVTMETTDFLVTPDTFTKLGQRWYLHAHKQARQVVGCEPTLSRSIYPTYKTE